MTVNKNIFFSEISLKNEAENDENLAGVEPTGEAEETKRRKSFGEQHFQAAPAIIEHARYDVMPVTPPPGATRATVTYCSNEEMSYQQSKLKALRAGLGRSLFVSVPYKTARVPRNDHQLCEKYKKDCQQASVQKAVQITGKQPRDEVWVLNAKLQLDADGKVVKTEDQKYVVMDSQLKQHYLEVEASGYASNRK
ncbi:hypothetical protein Bbelb_051490 [Branchiostoma belcheri]|nr:hypothetical protein Bbelb_051490 [Branchiostoma belcheri]